MQSIKFIRNISKFGMILGALGFSQTSFSQTLDLSKLSERIYIGDDKHRKKPCTLQIGPEERDFANRRSQLFHIKTDASELDLNLILKGGQNLRSPDYSLGNNRVQFNIQIENHRLELVTASNDALNIHLFRLFGKPRTDARESLMLDCQSVKHQRR